MGGITAVGACSAVTTAAVRAGSSRTRLITLRDDIEGNIACVGGLAPESTRLERLRQLLHTALDECAESFEARAHGERLEIPLYVAMPSGVMVQDLVRANQSKSRLSWSAVHAVGSGHAAGLEALARIAEALSTGPSDVACLAGVDVRSDEASVQALIASERFFGPGHPWGFVPGEAAGALLLATDEACKRLRISGLGRVRGLGIDTESASAKNSPNTGRALSAACHAALDALDGAERVGEIYCDLNGERSRSDEWGFTAPRVAHRCVDAGDPVVPAQNWGDIGSASGLLLIQLALAGFARGYARGRSALVWAASESGARAAALIESLDPAPDLLRVPASRLEARPKQSSDAAEVLGLQPSAAAAQDRTLIEEFVGEASFLYELRSRCLARLESEPAAEHHAPAVASVEHRLESQIDGVLIAGEAAREACERAIGEPGDVYISVRSLMARGSTGELLAYLAARSLDDRDTRSAVSSALAHAASRATSELIAALLAGDERQIALGLQLAADTGKGSDWHWAKYARLGPEQLGHSFPAALMRLANNVDAENLLEPWLASPDESLQLSAAEAFLALDRTTARRHLWKQRERRGFALALAMICQPNEQATLAEQLTSLTDDALACRALGVLGTPAVFESLLKRFESAPAHAAQALHRMTGIALFEDRVEDRILSDEMLTHGELLARRNGDAKIGVDRITTRGFSRDKSAWKAAWAARRAQASGDPRYVLGLPLSAAALLKLTEHPLLAPSAHRLAAMQLGVAFGARLPLGHDARVLDRLRAVAHAREQLTA
jgi:3-oxoacyl-[acyl-carrier-protein] synthase-1